MKRADVSDKSHVVEILSNSFVDNKSVNAVIKQDKRKPARIRCLMEYSFDVCHAFGEIWLSDHRQACALILFPDKKRTSVTTILWDLKLAFSAIGIDRVGAVMKREALVKRNHPAHLFAYLWFIGVDPAQQNKGIGSSFINELVAEYRKIDRPIYLETSMQKNIPFYKKLGFEIFESLELNYTLYHMRRF